MKMNLSSTASKVVSTTSKYPYKVQAISCRKQVDGNLAMQRSAGKSNFYKILSLDRRENVGLAEIKKAYRRMVLQYHPDVCPASAKEESTKLFLELQMAYETLSDPVSRKMYDYELGLVNPIGYGVGDCLMDGIRRSEFPRDVWEKQLDGLKKRSYGRMQRMKNRSR